MNLKNIREGLGLTQAALAEKLGVSPVSVCRYESGDREPETLELLQRIAAELGVSVDELLGESGEERKE